MNDRIICLVGESGSGKTTIAKLLESAGYNVIQSYTTRLQRESNEWGHRFVDDDTLLEHIDMRDYIIAYKNYDGYHYWAVRDQYKGLGTSIYVVDPDGIEMLLSKVGDAEIIVVYLKTEKETRILRMKDQGRSIENVGRRVGYDRETFKCLRCNWVVDANGSIDDTYNLVLHVIEPSNPKAKKKYASDYEEYLNGILDPRD
jgi:guanylate kinase